MRTNEVHGLEEWKIPKKEKYLFRQSEEQSSTQQGSVQVQAGTFGYWAWLQGYTSVYLKHAVEMLVALGVFSLGHLNCKLCLLMIPVCMQ